MIWPSLTFSSTGSSPGGGHTDPAKNESKEVNAALAVMDHLLHISYLKIGQTTENMLDEYNQYQIYTQIKKKKKVNNVKTGVHWVLYQVG